MEKETYLDKANALQKEIKELEHFLYTVTEFDKEIAAIPSVNAIMKKEVKVKVSVLGSRFFGCGTHVQNIFIPDSVRNAFIELAEKRKEDLEIEFKACFP